jgi:uncharacterized protein
MILDPLYIVLAIPGLLFGLYATWKTKSTFHRYAQYAASSRLTGAEAARRLLDREGLHEVGVEPVQGFLSDHYDPRTRTLRLSPDVYNSPSLSAIGVACHEAGHAIQHATHYAPLQFRSAMVPITQFSTNMVYILFLLGMFMQLPGLMNAAILLFSVVVLFTVVTLPVEWDASARAKKLMVSAGIVSAREQEDAGRVLNAAFLTYVSALVTALLTLLYFILRARR